VCDCCYGVVVMVVGIYWFTVVGWYDIVCVLVFFGVHVVFGVEMWDGVCWMMFLWLLGGFVFVVVWVVLDGDVFGVYVYL